VVIGNPPYAGLSANLTPHARTIVERYRFVSGTRIYERGALQFEKNLQDDYVKFFSWSEVVSTASGYGLLGFISNDGFLDTPTLRGMRWSLQTSFSELRFLALHGSVKRPIAGDHNVFDIQQGVAISILARHQHDQRWAQLAEQTLSVRGSQNMRS
jgi:predicted helicase